MKKRVLSFLLALVMIVGLAPVIALPARADNVIALEYDDYRPVSGTIGAITTTSVTSKQVKVELSEGVYTNTLSSEDDTAVVEATANGKQLHAVGVGTAEVVIDDVTYTVTVTPAKLTLFLMIGQSNTEGYGGNADGSVANENGTAYSSYGPNADLTTETSSNFIPAALSGTYSTVNINGTTANLADHPVNAITAAGDGKRGMDSAIAYKWHKLTGDKVWMVNAAHSGSSITTWHPTSGENYQEMLGMYQGAQAVMAAEIEAGHYEFSHMAYFWNQGTTDRRQTAEWYLTRYRAMHSALSAVTVTIGGEAKGVEFGGIIMVRANTTDSDAGYRRGELTSTNFITQQTFRDLEMTGPRVAQYYMGNSTESSDATIYLASNISDSWVYDTEGNQTVQSYFEAKYPNGINYPVQSGYLSLPTSPASIHPDVHYTQFGHNELGFDAAENMYQVLNRTVTEPTVKFYTWDGYTEAVDVDVSGNAKSESLVVPVVSPVYMSKSVSYSVDDAAFTYSNYDLTTSTADYEDTASLTAVYNESVKATASLTSVRGRTVTLSFDSRGGSECADLEVTVDSSAYGTLPTPTKENDTFLGWFTSATYGQGAYILPTTIVNETANHTVYALWASDQPDKLIWDFAGGQTDMNAYDEDGTVVNTITKTSGNEPTYSGTSATATNYVGTFAVPIALNYTENWKVSWTGILPANDAFALLTTSQSARPAGYLQIRIRANQKKFFMAKYVTTSVTSTGWLNYGGELTDWTLAGVKHTYELRNVYDKSAGTNNISLYIDGMIAMSNINKQAWNDATPVTDESVLSNNAITSSDLVFTGLGNTTASWYLQGTFDNITIQTKSDHQHSWSTSWNADQYGHWHVCTKCGELGIVYDHTMVDGTCSECGYRAVSAAAKLTALSVADSQGNTLSLDQTFNSSSSVYTMSIKGLKELDLALTYTAGATVKVATEAAGVTVTGEDGSWKVSDLPLGVTVLTVTVTKDTASSSYTLSVTRSQADKLVWNFIGGQTDMNAYDEDGNVVNTITKTSGNEPTYSGTSATATNYVGTFAVPIALNYTENWKVSWTGILPANNAFALLTTSQSAYPAGYLQIRIRANQKKFFMAKYVTTSVTSTGWLNYGGELTDWTLAGVKHTYELRNVYDKSAGTNNISLYIDGMIAMSNINKQAWNDATPVTDESVLSNNAITSSDLVFTGLGNTAASWYLQGTFDNITIQTKSDHQHSWAAAWHSDENGHWHTCSSCGELGIVSDHTYLGSVCSVCGYRKVTAEAPTLTALSFTEASLNQTFKSTSTVYSADLDDDVTTLTLNLGYGSSVTGVTVNFNNLVVSPITSTSKSYKLTNVPIGDSEITITVTGEGGSNTYTVSLAKAGIVAELTLAEQLSQMSSGTLKMYEDEIISNVMLTNTLVLDLNGHNLVIDDGGYLISFGRIKDSVGGGSITKSNGATVFISPNSNTDSMPVYENGVYRFYQYTVVVFEEPSFSDEKNMMKVVFTPYFYNRAVYTNVADNEDLNIRLKVSTPDYTTYVKFSDSTLQTFTDYMANGANAAMAMYLKGIRAGTKVTVSAQIVSNGICNEISTVEERSFTIPTT